LEKLSVLTFSRNNIDSIIQLINDIYNIADQIVVIDSSEEKEYTKLQEEKKAKNLEKVNIYHALALGYADPLREYGLLKCKYDWVLYLDGDERISEELRKNIRDIIGNAKTRAFALKRFEEATLDGNKTDFFTWNIRLFDKRFISFKGIIHEQPEVRGRLEKLPGQYYLLHVREYRSPTYQEYRKAEQFERFSYGLFNERLLDYISKWVMPSDRKIEKERTGKFILFLLHAYEKITLRKPEDEVSNFDYANLFFIRDLAYAIKRRSIKTIFWAVKERHVRSLRIKALKAMPDSRELFEISKKIQAIGIIKFLGLDDEHTIKTLNKRYKNQNQGISLLTKLLKERYKSVQSRKRKKA